MKSGAHDLWPVLARIGAQLEDDLSLDTLAEGAALSPFHFHRRFSAAMGETPKQYVARLRLERAALRLRIERASIAEIALSSGFANHETFARAFRRQFEQSPSEWRAAPLPRADAAQWTRPSETDAQAFEISETRVRVLDDLDIAFVRHMGPYENVPPDLWRRLSASARDKAPVLLGIAHDAPTITPAEKLRFDAGLVLAPGAPLAPGVQRQRLSGGPHAVTTYAGPFGQLAAGYARAFDGAARCRGYEIVGLPCIEFYRATDFDLAAHPPLIDIALPLRAK